VRQDVASVLIDLLGSPRPSTRDVKVAALIALGLVPIDVDRSEASNASELRELAPGRDQVRRDVLRGREQHTS
jgi:hypothetical protein